MGITGRFRKETRPRGLAGVDLWLFRRVAKTDLPIVDHALLPLTRAANRSRLWLGIAAILAAAGGRLGRRAALRGLISVGATSILVNLPAKLIARRARPSIKAVPEARRLARLPTSYSFPSGHSASAFAFATGVSQELAALSGPLYALASSVAYSRVYAGVHYPGDVIAGAAIGSALSIATRRFWPRAPRDPNEVGTTFATKQGPGVPNGRGVKVVVNPSSGPTLSRDPSNSIETLLPEAEIVSAESPEEIEQLLKEAASTGDVLGVAGGDGSVNCAAGVALETGKPLMLVPAGTLNHLARDLGLANTEQAAEAVKDGTTTCVDVARIDGRPFLNTASLGTYPELVDAREKLESKIGKWPALVLALIKVLRGASPTKVELDGEQREIWLMFIGNCLYRPAGFAPRWRERLDDGKLDVRILSAEHPLGRIRFALSVLTGTLARSKVYDQLITDRLKVRSLQGELRLACDGESFDGEKEFVVEKSGEQIEIFVPEPREDSVATQVSS